MPNWFRRWCRVAAANVFYWSGLFALWRFCGAVVLRRRWVCVLGLHRVLNRDQQNRSHSLPAIVLTEETFRSLLEHLHRCYRVVPLGDVFNEELSVEGWRKPMCLLTFDDGWRDNYTTAFPLLKRLGMPATIFLVTGLIGGRGVFWVERLQRAFGLANEGARIPAEFAAKLREQGQSPNVENLIEYLKHMPADRRQEELSRLLPPDTKIPAVGDGDEMLTLEQAMEMRRHGIEFGSHTMSHPLLTYEDDSIVKRELHGSREAIREWLGQQVHSFAYPNGDWDERIRRAVQEAGYACAFTTQRGWYRLGDDQFTIRRILLHEGNVTARPGKFSPAMFSLTVVRGR